MNQYLQNIIFFYILKNPQLALKCRGEFFETTYLKEAFDVLKPFVVEYKTCPSYQQAIEIVKLQGKEETIPLDVIEMIYQHESKLGQYTEEWLDGNTKAWLTWVNTMQGLKKTLTYVKTISNDVNIENYQEINERVKAIFNGETNLSFEDNEGSDFFDPDQHKTKTLVKTSTGIPFLDICTKGGYWGGSLWCFVGAPKVGKSMWLQNLCAKSIVSGNDCAYITLELQTEMVNQRIGSNLFNISSFDYDKIANDENLMRSKMKAFYDSLIIPPGKLWVKEFPTSSATIFDLESALLKREEQLSTPEKPFKFKNVYVDYINILKNYRNPNSENTYMKIKQIAEDLRAVAQRNKWCIITATQSNRNQAGTSDMTFSSVSESFGLIATCDFMAGIIADIAMKANGEYYLKILANRAASMENVRKRFTFDKKFLRIEEDKEAPIIDDNEIIEELNKGIWGQSKKPQQSSSNGGIVVDAKSGNNNGNLPLLNVPNTNPTYADLIATEAISKTLFD